jgi:hypothetical protein
VGKTESILRCKTCSTPVNSHKTTPSSPTPHLYRTTQTPDASEIINIHNSLRNITPVLHELDDDIAHVQAVLDGLRRKREPFLKFIAEQNTILAPIRRLPVEILIEVFMLCIDYSVSSFSPRHSPLLVAQVCRGWRQVAISAQKLWTSITVTYYRPSSAQAKLWMSRASSSPLTIRLDSVYPQPGYIEKIQPVIAVLVQHCDQWRHLELSIHHTMVPCLSSIKQRLPWLESLQIQRPTSFRKLDIFEVAPRLRNLSLGPLFSPTGLKVPWHQLTDLTIHISTIAECLKTLQLVPNVVTCTVYNESSISEHSILPENISILTFPHLRFFSILRIRPDEIFKYFQLPIIHTLHVVYQDRRTWGMSKCVKWFSRQPFMSLLSCSSHTLRKLVIDRLDEFEDSAHIAHCLRAIPSLEELRLQGPGKRWVTEDFLRLLTRHANIEVLVPGLEVLEIRDHCIPCHHCTSMIESRWRVGDDDDARARLKRLRFEISWIGQWLADAEILNRLRKCRQEGLVISIVEVGSGRPRDMLDIHSPPVT